MDGDHGEMKLQLEKGREGEVYIGEAVAKLGYNVLYVGGAQRCTIDDFKFGCFDHIVFKDGKSF